MHSRQQPVFDIYFRRFLTPPAFLAAHYSTVSIWTLRPLFVGVLIPSVRLTDNPAALSAAVLVHAGL